MLDMVEDKGVIVTDPLSSLVKTCVIERLDIEMMITVR